MIVVIGGGIAGVTCTEQLAEMCPQEQIVIVSASKLVKACTNVRQVSKMLTDFDVEERLASYLESSYQNVKVMFGLAKHLNCEAHELLLEDGTSLNYQKLCICTGGRPKLLDPGNRNVIGIRDVESISHFQHKLKDSRRIIVVGNGGIATELIYELENCEIIWVIKDASIGATFFDAGAAQFFLPCLHSKVQGTTGTTPTSYSRRVKYTVDISETKATDGAFGSALGPDWASGIGLTGTSKGDKKSVHVEYQCEVSEIMSHKDLLGHNLDVCRLNEEVSVDWPVYVKLTNGKIYGGDLVVSATGVEPNTQMFRDSSLKLAGDGGILVDELMSTNVADVYAAGDVCTIGWTPAKQWFQMRLWTQARQMGYFSAKCISDSLAGHETVMDICFDLFTHVTRFFGFKVILLGLYNSQNLGEDYELLLRMTKGVEYIKVVLEDGKMQGAILIGDTDYEETFENLILDQLDLTRYGAELLNPDIDIEDYFD